MHLEVTQKYFLLMATFSSLLLSFFTHPLKNIIEILLPATRSAQPFPISAGTTLNSLVSNAGSK